LIVSASTGARTNVAAAFFPSGRTTDVLTTQFLPSSDHELSPNAPVASKIHDRTRFASGSQPIHCLAVATGTPRAVVETVPVMTPWFSAQSNESRSPSPVPVSPDQSPTSQPRAPRCSALDGGVYGAFRRLLMSHWPSFRTWTRV